MLLDTCILIWLVADQARLSPAVRTALASPGRPVFVSAVSAWEIAHKASKGKIGFNQPVSQWFAAMLKRYALRELPITATVAARSCELPPVHADPFDRLLVATAQTESLVLVTPDPYIPRYPDLKTLW